MGPKAMSDNKCRLLLRKRMLFRGAKGDYCVAVSGEGREATITSLAERTSFVVEPLFNV